MSLFNFFRKAPEFVNPDPDALDQAGDDRTRHAAYHHRIVKIAIAFGILGAVGGAVAGAFAAAGPRARQDMKAILYAPILFGIGGAFFGTALSAVSKRPNSDDSRESSDARKIIHMVRNSAEGSF